MNNNAKDYFVTVGDKILRVGTITASMSNRLEDTDVAVSYHKKCCDKTLKIFGSVDNEPTSNCPRCTIHLHVDIENLKISVSITDNKTNKKYDYDIGIGNI